MNDPQQNPPEDKSYLEDPEALGKSFTKLSKSVSELAKSFAVLSSIFPNLNLDAVPHRVHSSQLGKTRKGATHVVNPTFLSRQVLPISPAQYRRYHFGNPKKWQTKQAKTNKKVEGLYAN